MVEFQRDPGCYHSPSATCLAHGKALFRSGEHGRLEMKSNKEPFSAKSVRISFRYYMTNHTLIEQEIYKCTKSAPTSHQIGVQLVLRGAIELDDVCMMQRAQNLYLE